MRLNRFAPLVLLGCLLFAANCGKDESVPTSGAVGHVVVVEGEVSARRGSEAARDVALKDTVFADDTIVTGEDGSVQILLAHNGALWRLGANQEVRIDKGIAYRAKTRGAGALRQEQDLATSAAGRGTVKDSADSVGTVRRDLPELDEDEEAEPEALPEGKADGTDVANNGGRPGQGGRADPKTQNTAIGNLSNNKVKETEPSPPSPEDRTTKRNRTKRSPGRPVVKTPNTTSSPSSPTAGTTAGDGANDVSLDDDDFDNRGFSVPSPPPAPPRPVPKAESKPSKKLSPEAEQIAFVKSAAQECHKTHGGKGVVSYRIAATGWVNATANDASLKPLVNCLNAAIRGKGLPNKTAVKRSLRFK